MEIPGRIKIGPFIYTVEFHDGYFNKDDERVYGEVDERTSTINIDSDASPDMIKDAVLHEIIHAILMMYEKDDEALVRCLTPMLLGVIKDNPKLMLALST